MSKKEWEPLLKRPILFSVKLKKMSFSRKCLFQVSLSCGRVEELLVYMVIAFIFLKEILYFFPSHYKIYYCI